MKTSEMYLRFWSEVLLLCRGRLPRYASTSPTQRHFIQASAGLPGVVYRFSAHASRDDAQVTLGLDRKKPEENLALLNALTRFRAEIDRVYGRPLEWFEAAPGESNCCIRHRFTAVALRDTDPIGWRESQRRLVDSMERLQGTMDPYLLRLR
jgi:hypothetical protein